MALFYSNDVTFSMEVTMHPHALLVVGVETSAKFYNELSSIRLKTESSESRVRPSEMSLPEVDKVLSLLTDVSWIGSMSRASFAMDG